MRDAQFSLLVFLFHLNEIIPPEEPRLPSFPSVLSFLPPSGPLPLFFFNPKSHVSLFFFQSLLTTSPPVTHHTHAYRSLVITIMAEKPEIVIIISATLWQNWLSAPLTPVAIRRSLYLCRYTSTGLPESAALRRGNKSVACNFFIGYLLHLRLLWLEKKK